MNLQEINRRLEILNEKKVPIVNKRMLRGGMQSRLRRQDIRNYARNIEKQKIDLNNKLILADTQKDLDFSIMSFPNDTIEPFHEPKLKRIRNGRSFFR